MRRLPPSDLDPGNPPGNQETSVGRRFRLAAVLSVYHNKLMCSFDETRDFMDYMAGERVYIWDIPVAMKICRKSLNRQYPWMKEYALEQNAKADSYPKFVRQIVNDSGSETICVQALNPGEFKSRPGSETI